MIWLGLLIGLFVGTFGGWMLCALCTVTVHRDQIEKIGRMRYTIRALLDRTEHYQNDAYLNTVRSYARNLLKEEA